jgi:hypothetical protein
MTLLEALQWFDTLLSMPAERRHMTVRRFVRFYLVTPLRQPGCPFLDRGACGVYSRRPFACRAYGLWSGAAGQARTRQHRDAKRALIRGWQDLGIRVAADSVCLEMDYCTRVRSESDRPPTDETIMLLLAKVYGLDETLTPWCNRFENNYHSDFSYLLTAMLIGARKSVLTKIAVIKEIAEAGSDRRLQKVVSRLDDRTLADRLSLLWP